MLATSQVKGPNKSGDSGQATGARAAGCRQQHAQSDHNGLGFQADERAVGALSLALGRAGIGILALTPELATLEDLFFRLTEDGDEAGGVRSAVVEPRASDDDQLVPTR